MGCLMSPADYALCYHRFLHGIPVLSLSPNIHHPVLENAGSSFSRKRIILRMKGFYTFRSYMIEPSNLFGCLRLCRFSTSYILSSHLYKMLSCTRKVLKTRLDSTTLEKRIEGLYFVN